MRCPRCNQELNPHSERCPNCGASTRHAVRDARDGDTMTRVQRQISVIKREPEVSDNDLSDASFSPVLKFDRPEETKPEEIIEYNPANHFPDESFVPVDLSGMIPPDEDESDRRHRDLSASIRHMINNKDDDLLAEYYFKDGITDLEKNQLSDSFARLEQRENSGKRENPEAEGSQSARSKIVAQTEDAAESMSESAKRLSEFPEEKGFDKFVTTLWEKYDNALLKTKSFFRRVFFVRGKRIYDKFDSKTSGFMNGILDRFYYSKFGSLKRKRSDESGEAYALRRKVWAVIFAVLVILILGFALVRMMTSSDLSGKWVVSSDSSGNPNIIMEFKPGGRAVISVKSDDGWHVHKQGRYSTNRKNGHDMLTITYEDGDVNRLYYIIDGDTGTFINVDTNVQVQYHLK